MTAPLSYTSTFGYYGLRVNPTFDQVLGTIRKPLRIPLPDRRAKWYANSPYRALLDDAGTKFEEVGGAAHKFRESGAAVRGADEPRAGTDRRAVQDRGAGQGGSYSSCRDMHLQGAKVKVYTSESLEEMR